MFRLIRRVSNLQKCSCLLLALLLLLASWGRTEQAIPLSVVVEYVIDGDSLMVKHDDKSMEVRLWGIDAPEYDQPSSDPSTDILQALTIGRKGTLFIKYRDRYDRYVAVLEIDELNINQELVKEGHAWVYTRYCNEAVCGRWEQMQAQAKANRHGLWADGDPIPPWRWKAKR